MDKSILLTGGVGFIGSHVCISLLEEGYNVFIIDNLENSSIDAIKNLKNYFHKNQKKNILEFFKGSICDSEILEKIFKRALSLSIPIKSVIHLAGLKSVSDSVNDPLNYWENNVYGTLNLLKVLDKFSCRNIVFSSSATVYGDDTLCPIPENAGINPINCYGTTKYVIEKLLNDIFKSNPSLWKICALRYFNPIGAHPSGVFGENCLNKPSNIFPNICDAALGKVHSLKIYGNDWPTPDGTCIRDYIHIMDLASGHLSALNYLNDNKSQFITINLGTGSGTSVLELINSFEDVNKVKVPYIFVDRRPGDTHTSFADNQLAINNLDWSPIYSLDDMCKHGWEYIKKIKKPYL